MRLYAGSSEEFITDSVQNQIAVKLTSAFFEYFLYVSENSGDVGIIDRFYDWWLYSCFFWSFFSVFFIPDWEYGWRHCRDLFCVQTNDLTSFMNR